MLKTGEKDYISYPTANNVPFAQRMAAGGVDDADGEFVEPVNFDGAGGVEYCAVGGDDAVEYDFDEFGAGGVGIVEGEGKVGV